ncbi:MAG: XRE family transcriptional regulator [Aquabacterium sp.]|uniref:helix-turn-helix domain-containing protein n=1 Tax=Aquabacterium sp. TaxID=1872578 RepID=UPI001205BBE0|nr:helix-turn-helix transcriptional regulator [Aquabacterium sp.]TAK82631.1 MAG: XRE family transcriptional regulator [Aquabacterium sp.]
MDTTNTGTAVTLEAFAERVGCHFTTASRIRAGHRLPGRVLLGVIVEKYNLDPKEALKAFTTNKETFGAYLRANIFGNDYHQQVTGVTKQEHANAA